jgi:4-aminobutyrate aminotransferase-like enzyme
VSCAAAIAVTDAFEEEKILDNVNARCGSYSLKLKAGASQTHVQISDPRSFSKQWKH